MKNIIILLFTILSITAYAGKITRMGEEKAGIRHIGTTRPRTTVLKGPTPPKQKTKPSPENIKTITDTPYKKWTSEKGSSIKAKLTGLSPISAVLEKKDGKKVKVPRNKLSDNDKIYLDEYDRTGKFPPIYLTKRNIIIFSIIIGTALLMLALNFNATHRK